MLQIKLIQSLKTASPTMEQVFSSRSCSLVRKTSSFYACFTSIVLLIVLNIGCCSAAICATVVGMDKVQHEVWVKLESGEEQDLIVVFDDSAILDQASQFNKSKGIMFDDQDTLRFKAERYAAIKQDAMSSLPKGEVEILKNYDVLPLMFLRFHTTSALNTLLAHPSVVKVYEDRQENLMHQDSRP